MSKKFFLQNASKYEEVPQKSNFFFYNNLGIYRVIICFTMCLCITKNEKVFA